MKEYTVNIGGLEHTMLLSDEDAKRMDAQPVGTKAAAAPSNKSRSADTKKKS